MSARSEIEDRLRSDLPRLADTLLAAERGSPSESEETAEERRRARRPLVGVAVALLVLGGLALGVWTVWGSDDETTTVGTGDVEVPPDTTVPTTGPAAEPTAEDALSLFYDRLATAHLFDERTAAVVFFDPRESVQAVVDAVIGGQELSSVQTEGYTFWPQRESYAALQRLLADEPELATAVTEADMPIAYGIIVRFADADIDTLVADLRELPGVVEVVRLEMPPPPPSTDPPGWELLATVDEDLQGSSRFSVIELVGDDLVIVSSEGVTAIDRNGRIRSGDPSPFGSLGECCGEYRGVAAKGKLVVLAESGVDAAVLDVASLTWTQVDDRPIAGYLLGEAWTGDEVVVVAAAASEVGGPSETAALDPVTGGWRSLPDVPEPINAGGLVSGYGRVVVSGTHQAAGNHVIGDRQPAVFELVDGEWVELPSPPVDGQASVTAPTPSGLVVWNYGLESAVFEDGQWRTIDPLPGSPVECLPGGIILPDPVVVAPGCGPSATFDPASATWADIELPQDLAQCCYPVRAGGGRVTAVEVTSPDTSNIWVRPLSGPGG